MALTLYLERRSPLHRLHPVTKLLALIAFIVAAFVVDDPRYQLPLTAIVVALLWLSGGIVNLIRFRFMFLLVFVFTVAIWTLFYGGAVFRPTQLGFVFGLSTAIRLCTFLATGLVFLTTTRVEEVAYALGRLGVPYQVGFTLTLAFRLVPVFFDSALTIVQAQRCRGLEFSRGGLVSRLKRYVPIIVPVFIGALRRADHMAMALELRGFNSGRPRTTYLRATTSWRDAVVGALALGTAALYVTLWAYGLGRLATAL